MAFSLALIGIAIVIVNAILHRDDPTPDALADEIERLLSGNYGGWDVDNFEHRSLRNPMLREYWHRSMAVGDLPEKWVRLGGEGKNQMREIIRQLRELAEDLRK